MLSINEKIAGENILKHVVINGLASTIKDTKILIVKT